jgi:hypothetical protein
LVNIGNFKVSIKKYSSSFKKNYYLLLRFNKYFKIITRKLWESSLAKKE